MTPVPVRIGLAAAALVCASGPMAPEAAAAEMTREPTAIIQGLDKVAARVSRFEAPVGRAVHYGKLLVLVRDCERSAPEDRPENAAFVEIYEERPGEAKERLFAGWMFSSSPALSALEHPVYDVTLLECKGAARAAVRTGSGCGFDRQTVRQIADENRPLTQRLGQQAVIAGAADLDGAELRQMRRHELRVEQPVTPRAAAAPRDAPARPCWRRSPG